jgi:hypothetical protein
MANYEQTMPFYPKDMGKQKGWCLQNCRLGFHIYKPKYASAKAAMDAAKRNGTYHAGTPPNNISVPVYVSSSSKYGHVVVWDKGTWWSDGKSYRLWSGVLGWDEMMDGTRVVKLQSGSGFLPAKGYWCKGDKDPRIGKLCNFYAENFYAYFFPKTKAAAHKKLDGNLFGQNCYNWTVEFQKRTNLYADGMVGPKTYAMLQKYGFKG